MRREKINEISIWKKLKAHAEELNKPENHLKFLLEDRNRLKNFSLSRVDFLYDFSHQRVTEETMDLLFELAEVRNIRQKFNAMVRGEKVNITENRPALHTAARSFSEKPVYVDGVNVMPEIHAVKNKIKAFSEQVHRGEICGSTGKPFRHIVVVGIGGSYLGTEFVSSALCLFADKGIRIHFLTNVDSHNFEVVKSEIEPESTLWIVISKSYTTVETIANANQATEYMLNNGLDPSRHIVTVTSKGSPGDRKTENGLPSFHMFDFIGGRYSVTSAVGGLPLSLYLGYDRFERFLNGAQEVDLHAQYVPSRENMPLIAALIGIWNNNFLGYRNQAIVPYASPLSKLPPHIQQLYMESNGKSVTVDDDTLDEDSGVIVFGEPGTNAQHSFFQLAHQGHPFPIDFIGAANPQHSQNPPVSGGVTNHQELWANLISQPAALAKGKVSKNRTKTFFGNRPSSIIIMNDLSPTNIGRLLSFYEAQTVYKAFIWDINPFDQFGVELGKTIATDIRGEIARKNQDGDYRFDNTDPYTKFYLETLFRGYIND